MKINICGCFPLHGFLFMLNYKCNCLSGRCDMENEKNNNENKDKNADAGRKTTAAVLAVVLIAGFLAGGGIYKIRQGANDGKTAEVEEKVTTITVVSDPAEKTEETTEEVTTAETTAEETTAVTTVPVTETPDETTAITTEVTEVTKSSNELYWESLKNSPFRNQNHFVYSDILDVIPMIESFKARFSPNVYNMDPEPEYMDIVGADVTYSYQALKPIEKGVEPVGGTLHTKRYYKVSTIGPVYNNEEYKYKTEYDVRSALKDYVTDSFIESHYITNYDEVPGRYTLFKIIDGELYVTSSDDLGMMVPAYGNVYNFDGKRCDVDTRNYSPEWVRNIGRNLFQM